MYLLLYIIKSGSQHGNCEDEGISFCEIQILFLLKGTKIMCCTGQDDKIFLLNR